MDFVRISGVLVTALVHGSIFGALVSFSNWDVNAEEPKLTDMTVIEASLAYKSTAKPTKQPQKPRRAPKPRNAVKPQGVSRDEQQVPSEHKPEPTPKRPEQAEEPDYSKLFEKYRDMRQSSEEEEEALPVEDVPQQGGGGAFDGSKHGFAEVSKGDPYMQELAADVYEGWEVPTLEKGTGTTIGCVRLKEDGRILETNVWKSENANIARSVELALRRLEEQRKSGNKPVPRHLMDATAQWICFKFTI